MTRQRHTVELLPLRRSIDAGEDRPVLEAALAAGLNIPHSCKSGHCGSCRARLIRGRVEYPHGRPLGLTEVEAAEGFVLLCQARALSDLTVEVRQVASSADVEIKTLPARIARLRKLAPDVMQVWLRLPAVERLDFAAGQYLDVLIERGRRRSFSIASPPHDSELIELHARHVPGGSFTDRLSGAIAEGALLEIEGPLGQFVYREEARPALLIAGGTGFAPLKAMLRHALERGSQRRFLLYWGARTPIDLYEEPLVVDWTRRHPQLTFVPVLSETAPPGAGSRRCGWVHEAVLADHASLAPYEVYAAGPPALIEAIRSTFPPRGLPVEQLHFDSFDYAE